MQKLTEEENIQLERAKIDQWEDLSLYFDVLFNFSITSDENLKHWIHLWSDLSCLIHDAFAWLYIHLQTDTGNPQYREDFEYFVKNVKPNVTKAEHRLGRKLMLSPYFENILADPKYRIFLCEIQNKQSLYNEKALDLVAEAQNLSFGYGRIWGKLTIERNGKELTLPQAELLLKHKKRSVREAVYKQILETKSTVNEEINSLLSSLIKKRDKIALESGFSSYTEYKFTELNRFDYTPKDCLEFHENIQTSFVPLWKKVLDRKKRLLEIDTISPWDLVISPGSVTNRQAFRSTHELIKKAKTCLHQIDPFFEECLTEMELAGHLDLESRKGKAPGGFNYAFMKNEAPFLFMNAVGNSNDLIIILHETGHAIHARMFRNQELISHKRCPSETTELAAMTMELLALNHLDQVFEDPQLALQTKAEKLELIAKFVPWFALIDRFQHWCYEHPKHTEEQRTAKWVEMYRKFGSELLNFDKVEEAEKIEWQKQLHLFEVPFYYIEYAFAQLGAIAIWQNYQKDPEKTIEQYKQAMSLGNTRGVPQVYAAAGIRFDFSARYIRSLAEFISNELDEVYSQLDELAI